jgi:hypothetical protein
LRGIVRSIFGGFRPSPYALLNTGSHPVPQFSSKLRRASTTSRLKYLLGQRRVDGSFVLRVAARCEKEEEERKLPRRSIVSFRECEIMRRDRSFLLVIGGY